MNDQNLHDNDLIDAVAYRSDLLEAYQVIRNEAVRRGVSVDKMTYSICFNIARRGEKPIEI